MKITFDWLNKEGACEEALAEAKERLNGGLPLSVVIKKMDRADWLIWLLHRTGTCNRLQLVKLACVVARRSLRFVPKGEERPRLAIEAAERMTGEDTPGNHAAEATRAAEAAALAAWVAARAAEATRDAAWDAAWDADAAEATRAAEAAAWAAEATRDAALAIEHKSICTAIRAEMRKASFKRIGRK